MLTNVVSPQTLARWHPGDVVCWKIPSDHTGIVSDRRDPSGVPYVIHNISQCTEQDVLMLWPIVGHYRYPAAPVAFRLAKRHNRKSEEAQHL